MRWLRDRCRLVRWLCCAAPPTLSPLYREPECVVCLEASPAVVFLPCCHLVCCRECAVAVGAACPMCRARVVERLQVRRP